MKNMPKHILGYNNFKYIFTPEKLNIKKTCHRICNKH